MSAVRIIRTRGCKLSITVFAFETQESFGLLALQLISFLLTRFYFCWQDCAISILLSRLCFKFSTKWIPNNQILLDKIVRRNVLKGLSLVWMINWKESSCGKGSVQVSRTYAAVATCKGSVQAYLVLRCCIVERFESQRHSKTDTVSVDSCRGKKATEQERLHDISLLTTSRLCMLRSDGACFAVAVAAATQPLHAAAMRCPRYTGRKRDNAVLGAVNAI